MSNNGLILKQSNGEETGFVIGWKPGVNRFPIESRRNVILPIGERQRMEALAKQILDDQPRLADTLFFGKKVRAGIGCAPRVLIGDKSEIRLLAPPGHDMLEYRIALIADATDLVVLGSKRNTAFEDYLAKILGQDKAQVLEILSRDSGLSEPTARRCFEDKVIFEKLLRFVRVNGPVTLMPFIATGSIWTLAKHLSDGSGESIFVAGPPPNLAQRVNDKLWFAKIVGTALGVTATPPIRSAYGLAALVGHVQSLSQKWEKIVIKVPDSAGSEGNYPIQTKSIRSLGARALRDHLIDLMSPILSNNMYPLMVEVWDCNVLASPSVQVWIPDKAAGEPRIEGVFDQSLMGDEGRFVGATTAHLEQRLDDALCRDAMKLALLFQDLGYFGRCSFDTVLVGDTKDAAQFHWIECNGRWGGVSLPMTFMNRVFAGKPLPAFVIAQRTDLDFGRIRFQDALLRFDDQLYDSNGPPEGIIFTAPGGLETGRGLNFIAVGNSEDDAKERAFLAFQRLTDV